MVEKNPEEQNSINTASKIHVFILSCFFLSGLTGLVYEILWTRLIVIIIGSAPFAVSIILTVFMGGLGLGSYIAGKNVDRIKNPQHLIQLYGILEIVIGVYGLLLPVLLFVFKPLYAIVYNELFSHFIIYNLITFVGCSVLLILPVICMGATLPILSRYYITGISHVGSQLGKLYGLNTIGAALGSLLCGFWIINALGVQGSVIFAVIINVCIGIACVLASKLVKPVIDELKGIAVKNHRSLNVTVLEDAGVLRYGALVIAAVSGFCAMSYEVIWTRLLGLIIGPTTYSFTIVLTTFIMGLALGSIFFGWMADKTKKTVTLLLFTQITAALFALGVSHILGNSQIFFAKLILNFKDDFVLLALLKSALLFIFMFFPTFFLGAAFPLAAKIYTQSDSPVGKSVGYAYSINTIGAVTGSFCAGFILIPMMGKENSLSLIVAIQLLASMFTGSLIYRKINRGIPEFVSLLLLVLIGLNLSFYYPHWDRKMLSKGKYQRYEEFERLKKSGWLKTLFYGTEILADYDISKLIYYGDSIGGFTAVIKDFNIHGNVKYYIYNSGKPDASSDVSDMRTQTLSAHYPMLVHQNPGQVMVIGLASGITAGEILYYPIEHLDVIDINSQMVIASNFFISYNNNVLSNPKTELIIQDARAHVGLTRRRYDVIISEPSNPWMAGLSSLFTYEFFDLVRNRLTEDGVFAQWIHSYQMDWDNFALIGRTFAKVFPNSILVNLHPDVTYGDLLLVGFNGDKIFNKDIVEQNFRYAQQSKNLSPADYRSFIDLIVDEDLESLFGKGSINTDNHPKLEFSAPKLLHTYDKKFEEKFIRKIYE